ncbi:hypothetical protein L6452_05378 [Arctium lappa]|uniref:Uncharacterized protein n=1 Tax=Arctium lappa TaxID=4217 RepID=A0ACB9EGQ0_ARCLA|nr:hypothetical protein L6452_05378 [Arctium lappa]
MNPDVKDEVHNEVRNHSNTCDGNDLNPSCYVSDPMKGVVDGGESEGFRFLMERTDKDKEPFLQGVFDNDFTFGSFSGFTDAGRTTVHEPINAVNAVDFNDVDSNCEPVVKEVVASGVMFGSFSRFVTNDVANVNDVADAHEGMNQVMIQQI